MNSDELSGISRSLFYCTANMPMTKNSRAGLVRLSSNKLKFMFYWFKLVNLFRKICFASAKVFYLFFSKRSLLPYFSVENFPFA